MKGTLFHTEEGTPVMKATHPAAIVSANAALKKAKKLGLRSLIATEPTGNRVVYTDMLLRQLNGAT